jgi:hypothetical protein
MKLVPILPLAVALAATSAVAQDSQLMSSSQNVVLPLASSLPNNCPVSLEVTHGQLFAKRLTEGGPQAPDNRMSLSGVVQRVHLTMTNPSTRKIVGVELNIEGYSSKGKTFTLTAASPDLSRTVSLALEIEGKSDASSDLSLKDFTAVSAVDVVSLKYADGSTWKASAGACHVSPKALMLVSSAR